MTTKIRQSAPSALGLPPSWYVDPRIFEIERRELFDDGPHFVGRREMTPRDGDYYALEGACAGQLLVRNKGQVRLVSNVCRHRQALMLKGRGNAKRIVCPVHNWAYDLDGRQIAAPHFPENPCLHLDSDPLFEWRGTLFAGPRNAAADLEPLDQIPELAVDDYVLDRVEHEEHSVNWKSFMEVFIEDYHVFAVHPGLRTFVCPEELKSPRTVRGEQFHLEIVNPRWPLGNPGSHCFEEYQRLLMDVYEGEPPPFGAVWLAYYPSTLIEFYPHAHIITNYEPLGPERTRLTSQYYFRRSIRESRPDFVAASHAIFAEVTDEDHDASVRLHEGRRALYRGGMENQGPFQQPMESGLAHFHHYLRRNCNL
jgi:phenylpropionate dioxygenase-like ring-hydroxylating dioxygenase large terminal subunit